MKLSPRWYYLHRSWSSFHWFQSFAQRHLIHIFMVKNLKRNLKLFWLFTKRTLFKKNDFVDLPPIREGLKKMWNLGFWLNLRWPLPRPPIWAPLSGRFFYCFIQIYTLQNIKQLYGVLIAHLIYSGNYGQNDWIL